jgi:acetolactate synthase-1/2/3 large subunit
MGVRFDWRYGFGNWIPADTKVIQIHTDARQIGFNRPADVGIVGGAGPAAKQLLTAVKARQVKPVDHSWTGAEDSKGGTAQLIDDYRAEGIPMHPARCAGEVCRFLEEEGRDWNIICDGGEAAVWMGFAATISRPGQFHVTGPNGTVGTGPGLAVGAWTANRKPVLWYTGDGSFGFYAMEMDTMAKLGIPVVCVISNDSSWGMIKLTECFIRPEEIEMKGHCNVELCHMRAYEKMVAMWNGYGECVNDPDQIVPAIRRAVTNGKPSIINVEVDKVSFSPMIAAYLSMVKPGDS